MVILNVCRFRHASPERGARIETAHQVSANSQSCLRVEIIKYVFSVRILNLGTQESGLFVLSFVLDGLMNGDPQKTQGACNKAQDSECLDEIASSDAP